MSTISPQVVVLCVMAGGGFIVLMFAAFHRYLGREAQRDPYARSVEQDNYMREVRQRTLDSVMPRGGRRGQYPSHHLSNITDDSKYT